MIILIVQIGSGFQITGFRFLHVLHKFQALLGDPENLLGFLGISKESLQSLDGCRAADVA